MKRQSILVVCSLLLGFSSQALASNCAVDDYDHNGSRMQVQACGGNLSISYVQPRQVLVRHGVGNGTLLFDGIEQPAGWVSGQARIFNDRCGEIAYAVAGPMRSGLIELRGDAPLRNQHCQLTGYRPDTLVFTLLGAGAQAGAQIPQVVVPSCPAGYVFSQGQCVRGGAPAPIQIAAAGDWYAIAGAFPSQGQAQTRASQLGFGWSAVHTSRCPNMTPGLWIAAAGPLSKAEAEAYAGGARDGANIRGAYVKTCHR